MKVVTKESIRELPLLQFEGRIHVIRKEADILPAVRQLASHSVLGFDTETKPTFKKGEYNHPALLQLSTDEEAYLFQLSQTGFTEELKILLEDSSIAKVGVAIHDDLKALKKLSPFRSGNFIELADLARKAAIPHFGLRSLTAYLLDKRISKSQQTSNWENETLSDAQQIYAATDAWVSLKIYPKLLDYT